MLLRTALTSCLAVALAASIACDPCKDDPDGSAVDVDGVELYEYEAGGTTTRIYRDSGGALHLVYVDHDRQLEAEGQRRATLTPEALQVLQTTETEIAGGAQLGGFDPQCLGFHDAPVARLWLSVAPGRLEFGYPWGCPPASLAQLDAMLQELVLTLPECGESTLFTDCEVDE